MRITRQTILTVPNAVSVAGFVLVIIGSTRLDSWLGFGLVAVGRLMDLVDGKLARSTHHASRFGAALDATLDKFAGLAIIIALWHYGMAPVWALLAIVLQNIANGIATALAQRAHPGHSLVPSRSGKYAMAVQNLAMTAFVVSYLIAPPFNMAAGETPDQAKLTPEMLDLSDGFYLLGLLSTVIGVGVLGLMATLYYIRRIRN